MAGHALHSAAKQIVSRTRGVVNSLRFVVERNGRACLFITLLSGVSAASVRIIMNEGTELWNGHSVLCRQGLRRTT